MSHDAFDAVQHIADAVLYEGYVLYPYRASAAKNQYRWQFGVVAPRAPRDDGETWFMQTECLVSGGRGQRAGGRQGAEGGPLLSLRVRCLRPGVSRDGSRRWLDGVPCTLDLGPIELRSSPGAHVRELCDMGIDARVIVEVDRAGAFLKPRIRLENHERWHPAFDDDRDAMLCHSMVGAHVLMALEHGAFESLLEPGADATIAAAGCRNLHAWPVLVGERTRRNLMLSSPIVLYDYPAVAPESRGDLFDAAEIDEILSLRILTMTDEEKREVRSTDPRAAALLDRVETMSTADLEALHGRMRSVDFFNPPGTPSPENAFVNVGERCICRGAHVRLHPNRRADAMDMFLRDQPATVMGVYRDVDDRVYVAVTVDVDPAATLHESFGRFFYFDPAEVEPLDENVGGGFSRPEQEIS